MSLFNHKPLFFIFCLSVSLIITGCDFGAGGGADKNTSTESNRDMMMSLPVPKALRGILVASLNAQVSIDGDTPIALEVHVDNTVSGQLDNVEAGQHQLIITYFVLENGVPVNIAVAIKNVDVLEGQINRVDVSESDLNRNFDDDLDGYTNLSEIRIGTQALNKLDSPGGETPLYVVANGAFGESLSNTYVIKHTVGEVGAGTYKSTNYVMRAGFGAY